MSDCAKFYPQMREGRELLGCLRCGRLREAHNMVILPADEVARQWLVDNGYEGRPYFDLVRTILTSFIRSKT